MTKPHLFSYIVPPDFTLTNPDALVSERDLDLLRITVEDFRFITKPLTTDLEEVAAEIRARSTTLRRLLCEGDLFNVGRLMKPDTELRVTAKMLDFEPAHPAIIITCGDYHWADDRLPGTSTEFAVRGVEPLDAEPWSYRENADVSLSEYLEGLSIAVLGTRIKRRQVIKYVADKKAAHVSDKRKITHEQALDRAWSHFTMTIKAIPSGDLVQLNAVYLETLAVIHALSESASINAYIDKLERWLSTAVIAYPDSARAVGISLPIDPI